MKPATIAFWILWISPAISIAQDAVRPDRATPDRELVSITEDLKVERLTDTVWRHISYVELEAFGRTPGNGLVVISGQTAALIDTPWTDDLGEGQCHPNRWNRCGRGPCHRMDGHGPSQDD